MKKIIITALCFIMISCSYVQVEQLKPIGMQVIGMTIEMLLEQYGKPKFNYSIRESGDQFYIYGNKSLFIRDGIVFDVRDVE